MTEPVVGILTDDAKSYSRPRFAEEASALGLTVRFLDPSHFDLLVDAKQLKTFYRNRPLTPPDAFMARTGSETGQFARAIIKQMESTSGVAVINSLDSILRARDKLLAHQLLAQRVSRSRAQCSHASRLT